MCISLGQWHWNHLHHRRHPISKTEYGRYPQAILLHCEYSHNWVEHWDQIKGDRNDHYQCLLELIIWVVLKNIYYEYRDQYYDEWQNCLKLAKSLVPKQISVWQTWITKFRVNCRCNSCTLSVVFIKFLSTKRYIFTPKTSSITNGAM